MRIHRKGELEFFIGRRYSDFARLHKRLRLELPGKVLPTLPKKNKSDTTTTGLFSSLTGGGSPDSSASSVSSVSTMMTGLPPHEKDTHSKLSVLGEYSSSPYDAVDANERRTQTC